MNNTPPHNRTRPERGAGNCATSHDEPAPGHRTTPPAAGEAHPENPAPAAERSVS